MSICLEIDSVLKSYSNKVILSDVYLKCTPGNIVGIFGRNGSGKSTFFNIIFGTCRAQRSFIRINDKIIYGKTYKTGMIVYLPQEDIFPKEIRIRKIIQLSRIKGSLLNDEIIKQVYNNRVNELSSGELRYVEILILLNGEAPFIILDEPFKGLSPVLIEKLLPIICECSKTKSIIISDHNYKVVAQIANLYMLLHEGYLRPIKGLDELKGIYII